MLQSAHMCTLDSLLEQLYKWVDGQINYPTPHHHISVCSMSQSRSIGAIYLRPSGPGSSCCTPRLGSSASGTHVCEPTPFEDALSPINRVEQVTNFNHLGATRLLPATLPGVPRTALQLLCWGSLSCWTYWQSQAPWVSARQYLQ